jgi:high affinity Mn2+ porin
MKKIIILIILCISHAKLAYGQEKKDSVKESIWTNHFQFTTIVQSHSGFHSKYSGRNSLADSVETGATTVTATLFLGRKLWKGASVIFNPELSGGRGLSSATGVAGALNGESYRVGNTSPAIFIARAYFQQIFALRNTDYETVADDVNQIAGKIPVNRITISAGKFALGDFFDDNKLSHDPRTQFINWSLMANGAWDYPANTRGYTMGVEVELVKPKWSFRFSSVAVPRIANAPKLEYNFSKAHSETLEIERKLKFNERKGSFRVLISNTLSKAPSYTEGLKAIANNNTFLLDVISGKKEGNTYGGKKFGIGYSFDQELTKDISVFNRASWNDGKYATWAFTEIDQTASAGISLKGTKWNRPEDTFGLATVLNGISKNHQDFLKAGGYGFIIGDGNLNYGNEMIIETYYNIHLLKYFWLTADYQFVNNPGYNKDRGPVHVFALRGHIEF